MRGLDVVGLGLRAVALSAVFAVLGVAPIAANAGATTVTVDCSQIGVQATTWAMIALDDLTIPVPAPYTLQGQCALADFNGDGRLDLLNQTATGDVVILYQKSDGKYRQIDQRIAKDAFGLNWSAQNATLVMEDVNGDGRADIRLQSKDVGGIDAVLMADSTGKIYGDWPVVGITPGSLAVGPTGAASYTIPLNVPPGINVAPNLSLSYNSNGQNGLMGVGWALSGLSAITRCPTTKATDGVSGTVNYDAADRFCLDGQRLILTSGTYGYGGSTYRTELDTFSLVTAIGSASGNTANGPNYFIVRTKDGSVLELGRSDDSRIQAQGKGAVVGTWALFKISDRADNFLTVSYTEKNTTGEFYPARIDYTGRYATGTSTPSSVTFEYEARPDVAEIVQVGSTMRAAVRLSHVRTFVGAASIRDYRITYDVGAATAKSRVKTVQECALDTEWRCLAAIQFTASSADRVTAISSKYGATVNLTYLPLTDPSVYIPGSAPTQSVVDFVNSTFVVSKVQTSNPIPVANTLVNYYMYSEASVDPDGRGFLGFRWIKVGDQTSLETISYYSQQFPTVGLVTAVAQWWHPQGNSRPPLKVKNVSNTATYKRTLGSDNTYYYFPYVSSGTEIAYDPYTGSTDGSQGMTSTTSTSYDDYGNVLLNTVTTSDGYTKTTTNTFNPPDTANWLVGQLIKTQVTNSGTGLVSLTRTSGFSYYPTTGFLKQEKIEPGDAAFEVTTDYVYDAYGRRITTTVSGAGTCATATVGSCVNTGITTRTTSTQYDVNGRLTGNASSIWANKVTNALGQTETQEFDPRSGAMTKLTGPNGLATNLTYDAFGRKSTETRADNTQSSWTYAACDSNCPATAVRMVTSTATGEPDTAIYFDSLSREVRTRVKGFNGVDVFVNTEYDTNGRVYAVTRPYYLGTPANQIYWSYTWYDFLGRVIQQNAANGAVTKIVPSYNTVTITDANGHATKQARNGLGQLVQVTDAASGTIKYKYDAFGNLLSTTDPAGNLVEMKYNQRGQKTKLIDKDMGTWNYVYDVLGQLLTQTDAKSQVSTMTYDKLGRLTQRVEPGMTSTWSYDTAANGKGKLASTATTTGYSRAHTYDSYGRDSTETSTIDGVAYGITTGYDTAGRVSTVTYPTGFSVTNNYNAYGYQSSVSKTGTPTTVYWTANTQNAYGQVTEELLGNYVKTKRTIDPATGWVQAVYAGISATGAEVQSNVFVFDALGNLTNRQDDRGAIYENFEYDALYRLTKATGGPLNNAGIKSYTYDSIGNITSKTDVGTYAYTNGRPHAVSSVSGTVNASYLYDGNGNMYSGNGVTIGYTAWNMPSTMSKGTTTTTFGYDSEHQRTTETVGTTKKSVFINPRIDAGIHYEVETTNGLVENRHTIYARGVPVAQYTSRSNSTSETVYYHKDHLGSIVGITNSSGIAIAQYWYDAWGKRTVLSGQTDYTHHGFTGHQQLDDYGLVHMNGRIYDPVLGRFQTADPNVFYPESTQGFNRYSYVDNNPLSYTDPSGFRNIFRAALDDIKSKNWSVVGVAQIVIGAAWMTAGVLLAATPAAWAAPFVFSVGLGFAGSGACDIGLTCQVKEEALRNGASVSIPYSADGFGTGASGSGGSSGGSSGGANAVQVLRAQYEKERDWYYQSIAGFDVPPSETALYADGMLVMGAVPPAAALAAAEYFALQSAARAAAIKVAQLAVNNAAKGATQIAQEGGRHAGQLQQFLKQTPDQLQKTINSFDKQIAKHEGWIADPASKVQNFSQLRPEHQQNLIHHWQQDILRHQGLKSIAQDVLKGL